MPCISYDLVEYFLSLEGRDFTFCVIFFAQGVFAMSTARHIILIARRLDSERPGTFSHMKDTAPALAKPDTGVRKSLATAFPPVKSDRDGEQLFHAKSPRGSDRSADRARTAPEDARAASAWATGRRRHRVAPDPDDMPGSGAPYADAPNGDDIHRHLTPRPHTAGHRRLNSPCASRRTGSRRCRTRRRGESS